jgi:hypothetical protein
LRNRKTILKRNKENIDKHPEKIRQKYLDYKNKYPWKIIWNSINQRCNNPNSTNYKYYGGKGIKNSLTQNDTKVLWFRDKAYEMQIPSIDRIDNDGHYEYENCRFIEFSENSAKDKRKPILQFDLEGNFIREFSSISEANRYFERTDSHIDSVANGIRKTTLGYIWRYKNAS